MKMILLFLMAIISSGLFGIFCVSAAIYTSKYMAYEDMQNSISAAVSFALALAFAFLFIDTVRDINEC